MNTCGVCDVEVDGIGSVKGGLGFTRVSDGNLENFAGQRRCGCWGVRMSVSVVGRSEFVGDGIFKYVFGNAATP